MDYQTYYESIEKPFFSPEPWVFGFAWGIIYPLIAIAFLTTIYLVYKKRVSWKIFALFSANIGANLLFTPIQLGFPDTVLPTIDIAVVFATLLMLQWLFYKEHKILFLLLLPYLGWASFATVLQFTIY